MSIITSIPDAEATGAVAEIYAADIADQGFVASHTRVLALNPEAYNAWEELITTIGRPMDKRRYELVTLAAALGARSRHCRLAHGRKSLRYFTAEELVPIASDYRSAGLSDAEVAMMEFAEQVSVDASSMTDADSQRLREVGFTDREIVDIALAAAARNFFSRAIQALAVEVDVPDLPADLREALVSGI
jgi:uncharacterized peroxidase-related enzyme